MCRCATSIIDIGCLVLETVQVRPRRAIPSAEGSATHDERRDLLLNLSLG